MPPRAHQGSDLAALLLSPKNRKEMQDLLKDLFTKQERDQLEERWQLVQELMKGTPQRDIAKKLRISISKVTRGSHALEKSTGAFERGVKRRASK